MSSIHFFLAEIDECDNQKCSSHGTCEDRINDYYCLCLAGYTGKDCEYGTSISCCLHNPSYGNNIKLCY